MWEALRDFITLLGLTVIAFLIGVWIKGDTK
jgi:hypothetical protein